ncbi:MAG: site-specific integrase [Phycisphaerae bacterium]|nr:site-specific integrase [Phycisphaerae bacterium]
MPKWSKNEQDKVHAGRGILRKLKRIWHFHFRDERGVWRSLSTRHRDKKGALLWAEGMSLKLTRAEFGLPEPPALRADDRVESALDGWLEYQRVQNTPNTYSSYRSIVAGFRKFLSTKRSITRLPSITTETVLDFRQWSLDQGNDRVTVDNKLIALRSFFNWCKATGRLHVNPASQQRYGVRLLFDEESPRKVTYTEAEYRRIRDAAEPGDRSVFVMLASTGMRCSELGMLEWSDLDRDLNILQVRRKITADGVYFLPKDKTDRVIPVSPLVWQALDELGTESQGGYVVPLPPVGSRADYFERTYLGRLKALATATGIEESKLTLHNFRRFFVSHCAEVGIPMATVMEWVGHDEMAMVMHYYRLRNEFAQKAMRRFVAGLSPAALPERDGSCAVAAPSV